MEEHKDYKLKSGNILRVIQDENSKSPDSWENQDLFLVYDHRQFSVKREGFEPRDIFDYLNSKEPVKPTEDEFKDENGYIDYEDYDNAINDYQMSYNDYAESINLEYNNYYIFEVDTYIHSGVHLSLANTANYPDRRWDVSTTGYVLVKKDLAYNIEQLDDEQLKEDKAKECAKSLIKTWNQYLSGDVWGFQVMKQIKTYTITEEDLAGLFINRTPTLSIYDFISKSEKNTEYEEIDSCWNFYGDNPKTNGMLDYINDELLEK